MLTVGLSNKAFFIFQYHPSGPSLSRIFNMKNFWIFVYFYWKGYRILIFKSIYMSY